MEILPRLQVLARSSPVDKKTLVEYLKDQGEIVAVTGDGTNDAPALKAAHIGFSMGISGTEVAIAASSIVLLNDNFASIIKAVLWGRNIFDAIRKFIQFQLTVNIVAVVVAFVGSVSSTRSPLTALQLLWVNLIMDTLAALALGTETPTPDLLDRKPYGAKYSLISVIMVRNIVVQSVFQLFVLLGLLYAGPKILDIPESNNEDEEPKQIDTIIFNTFVFCQVFNEFNARVVTPKLNVFSGVYKNWIFMGVIFFTVVLQALLVEFGGDFLSTVGLSPTEWGICIGIGFCSLPIGFLGRLIPVEDLVARYKERYGRGERTPLLEAKE